MADGSAACVLLSGLFEDLVQVALAVCAVLGLVLKRFQEVPQRPWLVWFLDVGKQCAGASYAHGMNLLISMAMSNHLGASSDECAWYFFLFIIDVTVGTFFNVLLLTALLQVALRRRRRHALWDALARNGDYSGTAAAGRAAEGAAEGDAEGDARGAQEMDYGRAGKLWLVQTCAWLAIVSVSKVVLLAFLAAVAPILDGVGNWLFRPVRDSPHAELLIVMVMVPSVCNILQFWVQDSFLKRRRRGGDADGARHLPLLHADAQRLSRLRFPSGPAGADDLRRDLLDAGERPSAVEGFGRARWLVSESPRKGLRAFLSSMNVFGRSAAAEPCDPPPAEAFNLCPPARAEAARPYAPPAPPPGAAEEDGSGGGAAAQGAPA